MLNYGHDNEIDYKESFNEKRIYELTCFQRYIIANSFTNYSEDDRLIADQYGIHVKPDLYITNGKETHYYSIKSGRSNFLQEEHIRTFVKFLYDMGVSVKTCKTILYFHYGDGTTDGSGTRRMNFEQTMQCYKAEIQSANDELAQRRIIEATAERYAFTGGHNETKPAEFIIYGYKDFGIMASEEEVRAYAQMKFNRRLRKPHIGPFSFRPKARNVKTTKVENNNRHKVVVEWDNMLSDLLEISHLKDIKNRK